jgi:hypothetical protein
MRWEELFEDLEAQLAALAHEERDARVEELTRAENAAVRLTSRLRSSGGRELTATLVDGSTVRGRLVAAADTWFELAEGTRRHVVVLSAVAWAQGLARESAPQDATRRLSLGHALRAISRDRSRVVVRTLAGTLAGRVERVGRDYVELDTGTYGATDAGRAPSAEGVVVVALERMLSLSEAR